MVPIIIVKKNILNYNYPFRSAYGAVSILHYKENVYFVFGYYLTYMGYGDSVASYKYILESVPTQMDHFL